MEKKRDLILNYASPTKKRGTRWGMLLWLIVGAILVIYVFLILATGHP